MRSNLNDLGLQYGFVTEIVLARASTERRGTAARGEEEGERERMSTDSCSLSFRDGRIRPITRTRDGIFSRLTNSSCVILLVPK